MSDTVKLTIEDGVAVVSLNRPDRHNAFNDEMDARFFEVMESLRDNPDVRCVVWRGEGKSFSSGRDTKELGQRAKGESDLEFIEAGHRKTTVLWEMPVPIVVALKGYALGGSFERALLCDIRIASEHAKFGQLFVKLGLMADVTGYWRLPQLVGYAKAAELLFTGDTVDAAEAERIGLVSRVLPADELLPAAHELAGRIAANPPQAVRYIKEGLRRAVGRAYTELPEVSSFVANGLAHLFTTKDHQEAAAAFMEKRAPIFTGE